MQERQAQTSRVWIFLTGFGLMLCLAACSQAHPAVVEQVRWASERVPVVFVPGVTGVSLRDRVTGESAWGRGHDLISPHDRGHGTARPLFPDRGGPDLVSGRVILNLRLFGLIRIRVYQELLDLFERNGYRLGDLERPRPETDFFLFAYDWRQDNVDSAARLAAQLDRLRQVRGQSRLRVNLICQSNGAHICRYFTKYGGVELETAESGEHLPDELVEVEKMVLVGSSNGGSIRILRELNRGRRYVKFVGRFWSPETIFSYLSLYQDLPAYSRDLFVDERGQSLDVDLYSAESWRRYGWSVFDPGIRRELAKPQVRRWFGSEDERFDLLQTLLDRARRFQQVLRRDVAGFGTTRYYLIMNARRQTASRAALIAAEETWLTLFEDDKRVRHHSDLRDAVISMGDGHATLESQRWLSDQESRQLARPPLDVDGSHRRVILQPATHQALLEILAEEHPPRP